MRATLPLLLVLVFAGCASQHPPPSKGSASPPAVRRPDHVRDVARAIRRCPEGSLVSLGSRRRAYVGQASGGAVARGRPGGRVVARFGSTNVNHYPTVFGVVGVVRGAGCGPAWYRVQLPIKPNGTLGYVRAASLRLSVVTARIVVDISRRRLTVYEGGRAVLAASVAVGSPSTPTPTGRYYVNQRLLPADTSGPYGPAAIGISAYSTVLTGWTQGGPVAIHGTDEPWSIGHAVSNGCIRLRNDVLEKVFAIAAAGTPVIITA